MRAENNRTGKKGKFLFGEFFYTLCIFFVMLIVILAVFSVVAYKAKLTSAQNSVDSVSEYLVASYSRHIDEINNASKQTFIAEDLFVRQDEYRDGGSNDAMYTYINEKFGMHNSSMIVGMGYIPCENGVYANRDLVYSGAKSVAFSYIDSASKALIDTIVEKCSVQSGDSGKMVLIYYEKWDMHIFARVVRDIRFDTFDNLCGIGFVEVNSAVFRQLRKFGNVLDGFDSYVIFNREPLLDEELPTEKLTDDGYYIYHNGFSQYCDYYGIYDKSAIWRELLPDGIAVIITFVVVMVLFICFYKRNHDKYTRAFVYLIDEFRKIGDKTLLTPIAPTENDENVNRVIETYNRMVANVVAEREKNEQLSEEKRQGELQSLYQQINKHFVINVLSVAHSLIQLGHLDKANECVENLADFLRYSLSINVTEAPLGEEIDSVLSYVNLQKLRFPNVSFDYRIDGDTEGIILPKSVIQPLIENAYVHGIKNKNGCIFMEINRSDSGLKITVINTVPDGSGEDFDEVNRRISDNRTPNEHFTASGHGIALRNIRRRLEMKFRSAEVYLVSKDGKTFATIEIAL